MIEAVVFDLGKVLIEWHPERFYDFEIGIERRKLFFAAVDVFAMNERIDLGADFQKTVYDFAKAHPDWQTEIRMWHDRWIEMASPPIKGSVKLLQALKSKNMPVFALTNFGIGTLKTAEKHYPFLHEFDRRYVSGDLKTIKPDAGIYQALEQDCGIEPKALLFTDDRPENITAAQARGWKTHLFDGPSGWAKCLVSYGVLTRGEAGLDD